MSIAVTTRKFTVDEYHTMIQSGILHEDDRVELLEGEIVEMSPISSRHAACVNFLSKSFNRYLPEAVIVAVQNPLYLGVISEPQPDLSVLAPRDDFYRSGHPSPKDVYFIVEVSETSQQMDRNIKVPLYARAGIREVWLIDLVNEVVERYLEPQGDAYQRTEKYVVGQEISPQAFPDYRLAVKDILLK